MSITPITPITPEFADCELWPVDPACFTDEWTSLTDTTQARSLALASATLRRLSGYRVTNCPIVVRPCKKSCAVQYPFWDSGAMYAPHIGLEGYWINSCGCTTDCACSALCSIRLPGPIGRVDEVLVGATDIVADVQIANNDLVYIGTGDCPFPACQDLSKPPGDPDTFTVTYVNGYVPDSLAAYAAGILTMEFAKACTTGKCRLPNGTVGAVRQGVSIEIAAGSFPGGNTGIREVDAWIALWRPERSPRWGPRVWSPDLVPPRIQG